MPTRQPHASAASSPSHSTTARVPNTASFIVLGVLTLTTIVVAASTWNSTRPSSTGSGACVSPFGAVNGQDASGVIGYSNCNDSFVSDEESYVNAGVPSPVYAGLKWQCVEYGRRWLIYNLQVL